MEPGIHIEVIYFDEDLVELRIQASNGRFAATTELYERLDALPLLAAALDGFPTSPNDVRERTLGTFRPAHAGGGVRLRFACTDELGHAAVDLTVRAVGTRHTDGGKDRDPSAEFTIPVEPAAVDEFVDELRDAEVRKGWSAHLRKAT